MTNRTIGLSVTLDKEYRVDDAEFIINAIKMIKGVICVDYNVSNYNATMEKYFIKQQLKNEMFKKLHDFFEMESK